MLWKQSIKRISSFCLRYPTCYDASRLDELTAEYLLDLKAMKYRKP